MINRKLQKEFSEHPVMFYLNQRPSDSAKQSMFRALKRVLTVAFYDDQLANLTPSQSDKVAKQVFTFPWSTRFTFKAMVGAVVRLHKQGYSEATVEHSVTAVRGIMKMFYHEGYISNEKYLDFRFFDIEMPDKIKQTGRLIHRDDYERILESCEGKGVTGIRDAAMLAVLWDTGVRVSELVNLRMKDYRPRDSQLVVRGGKGEKYRLVPINNGEQENLEAYLEVRGREAGPLFLGINPLDGVLRNDMKPLTRFSVNKMLRKRQEETGIEHFTPHDFRRTAIARWSADPEIGLRGAQKLAGHADLGTTAKSCDRVEVEGDH